MSRQPWELSAEEMLPAARALRARGASHLERGDFEHAERACEHALRFVEYEDAFDGAEAKADARRVKLECLVDVSACALERGDAQKAARVAEAALIVDPSSADATLRRAFASAAASAFDGAVADAEKAAALAPGDARVAAERARVLAMRDEAYHAFAPKLVPDPLRPAVSAPLNKQPVPLFHARIPKPPREINSPVPPGTAAAARALAAEEAEGECEAHREGLGLGGMDIGVEAPGDESAERAEHGYAPAFSEEGVSGDFGSPGGSGGVSGGISGGATPGAPIGVADSAALAVGSDGAPVQKPTERNAGVSGGGRGSGSLGHVPPNHPARPAVSGATPARDFSGQRGGLSAGPADGSMDVMGGGGGGQSFGNELREPNPFGTLDGTTPSAVVSGARSMQKNAPPLDVGPGRAQYGEVALGGDESEEDGEEIGSRNPAGSRQGVPTADADVQSMHDDDA